MLVLSRKQGEVIEIGSDISIRVVSISGGRVRLGIEAPKDVRIMRAELLGCDPVDGDPIERLKQNVPLPIRGSRRRVA